MAFFQAQEAAKKYGWAIELTAAWFEDNPHKEKYVAFRKFGLLSNTREYIFSNNVKKLIKYIESQENQHFQPKY